MKGMKKLLTLALTGALFVGMVATSSAAELDLAWYAAKNPDVVAAFGNSPEMLKLHYEMFGRKEARMANSHDAEAQLRRLFNPTEYGTLYPDVKAAFGENAEAMFQHYIAYGLLESRRPSEKVSKETAANLKKTVEKAMASVGLAATPGSAQLVAIITGEIQTSVADVAVQQVMTQVASVVEKAVTETVQKVNNPSSGGGGGSSSSSSTSGGSNNTSTSEPKYTWTITGTRLFAKSRTGAYTLVTAENAKNYFTISDNNPTKESPELLAIDGYAYATDPGKTQITNATVGDYVEYKPAALGNPMSGKDSFVLEKESLSSNKGTYFEVTSGDTKVSVKAAQPLYDSEANLITTEDAPKYVDLKITLGIKSGAKLYKDNDGTKAEITTDEELQTIFEVSDDALAFKENHIDVYTGTGEDEITYTKVEDDGETALKNSVITIEYSLGDVADNAPDAYKATQITSSNKGTYMTVNDAGEVVLGANTSAIYKQDTSSKVLTTIAPSDFRTYFDVTAEDINIVTGITLKGSDGDTTLNNTTVGGYVKFENGVVKLKTGSLCYVGSTEASVTLDSYDDIDDYVTITPVQTRTFGS